MHERLNGRCWCAPLSPRIASEAALQTRAHEIPGVIIGFAARVREAPPNLGTPPVTCDRGDRNTRCQ
jgi:hypothetical protein